MSCEISNESSSNGLERQGKQGDRDAYRITNRNLRKEFKKKTTIGSRRWTEHYERLVLEIYLKSKIYIVIEALHYKD